MYILEDLKRDIIKIVKEDDLKLDETFQAKLHTNDYLTLRELQKASKIVNRPLEDLFDLTVDSKPFKFK